MSTRISWGKHTFSSGKYIGIYFFQVTIKKKFVNANNLQAGE